jgi:hypothetical protein
MGILKEENFSPAFAINYNNNNISKDTHNEKTNFAITANWAALHRL